MVLEGGREWAVYWVLESQSNPGTLPTNPALNYLGTTTSGRPSPNPNMRKVRGSGHVDFIQIHRYVIAPECTIEFIPANVAFFNATVPSASYFSLLFYNSTRSQYLQLNGCRLNTLTIRTAAEEDVTATIRLEAIRTSTSAPTLGTGGFGGTSSDILDFANFEVSKNAGVLNDWTEATYTITNELRRRYTPATRITRALEWTVRDNIFNYTRDMDHLAALDEYNDLLNNNDFTLKMKMSNVDGSSAFSVNFFNAVYDNIDFDLLDPEELVAKRLSGAGKSVSFTTF